MIIVQEIQTMWSKASRGGPGATARNAVPERLAFKLNVGGDFGAIEHLVRYNEWDGFSAKEMTGSYAVPASVRYGCVRLIIDDQHLRAIWRYDPGYLGAPGRDSPEKEAFVVGIGSWGCVRYNGRLAEEEGWLYRKVVLNVGLFGLASGREFITCEPDFIYDQMAHLL